MTDIQEIIKLIALAGSAFISFFCCLIILINRFDRSNKGQSGKISAIVAGMFFSSALAWFFLLFYILHPKVFIYMHPAMYLAILYYVVLLYCLVFRITRTKDHEHFSILHSIIPLFIVGTIFISSFFVPFDIQLTITESRGKIYGDYQWYALLMTSKAFTFFSYNLIYSLLGLRRIREYQKAIQDYSADEGHSPVRWLYLLFYISLGSLPILLLGSFLGKNPLFYTSFLVFPLMVAAFQDIIICYNVVVVNFKIIEPEQTMPVNESPDEKNRANGKIDKETFERYIRRKKPYLNPDLRITDMASDLLTNRTYMSAFINREYGMHFSRYINHLRLKELTKLQADPDYADLDGLELVQKAGFSSYRGYTRTKNEEDRETTIKMK